MITKHYNSVRIIHSKRRVYYYPPSVSYGLRDLHPKWVRQMYFRGNCHKAFNLLEGVSIFEEETITRSGANRSIGLRSLWLDECTFEINNGEFLPGWRSFKAKHQFPDSICTLTQRGGGREGNIRRCRGRCFAVLQLAAWKWAACRKSTLNASEAGGFWESVWQQRPAKQLQ